MKKNLSALSAPVSAPSAPSADFTFCVPADCRDANYALLLADRHMRWFQDFDPYGVEFDDRAAVLLETAAALLRGSDFAKQLLDEMGKALEQFDEDDHESDLYQDGKRISADILAFLDSRNAVAVARKIRKPEVFYTGGGIWLSAMWLDENRYAVTDNSDYMGGFCIYDHREEDQDTEFPCQNLVGEKCLTETDGECKMTDEDRYTFFQLHNALLREADNIDLNGKWCADIIHTDGADTFPQFAYRGTFYFENGNEATAYGVDWQSFCTDVRLKTSIVLPLRKDMRFFKLSDYEQIAGLDAAHERGMVQVTKKEIFVNGWRASEAIYY